MRIKSINRIASFNRRILFLPLIVFFLFFSQNLLAEESKFTASVSTNNVAVGNQIQVTFTLEGTSSAKNFQAPSFSGFSVLMGPSQSSSTSIMNGSISQSITLTYVIQADKEGSFTIGAA